MLAACHGQIWNASTVSASLGVSYHTVNSYLDYLQNAFLVTVLRPYHDNIGKRLVKSPKIYWNDSGILHALIGVSSLKGLPDIPAAGAGWEGFCLSQILGVLKALGKPYEAYFFRTGDGQEIDLLLCLSGKRLALEFKLTSTPSELDFKKFENTARLIGTDALWLVSKTKTISGTTAKRSTNLAHAISQFRKI